MVFVLRVFAAFAAVAAILLMGIYFAMPITNEFAEVGNNISVVMGVNGTAVMGNYSTLYDQEDFLGGFEIVGIGTVLIGTLWVYQHYGRKERKKKEVYRRVLRRYR